MIYAFGIILAALILRMVSKFREIAGADDNPIDRAFLPESLSIPVPAQSGIVNALSDDDETRVADIQFLDARSESN